MSEREPKHKKISEEQFKETLFKAVVAFTQDPKTVPIAQGLLEQLAVLEEAKANDLRITYFQDADGGISFNISRKPRLGFLK